MSRGVGSLQREVVRAAYSRWYVNQEQQFLPAEDVLHSELLSELFEMRWHPSRFLPGRGFFIPAEEDSYQSATASLSRSCRSLEDRRLVTRERRGIALTEAGRHLAVSLGATAT